MVLVLKINTSIRFVSRPNRFLLYFIEEGTLFEVNAVGKIILENIRAGKDLNEIVTNLIRLYGLSENEAKEDAQQFINLLIEKNILVNE